ncbi:DUF2357 domain-containing protein [Pleurocapsales cyanobacterium LEGE 06147]|nr:DUF2357 domain-containing protein [Pleurocapsales cyanobacterium LEGE 06147]
MKIFPNLFVYLNADNLEAKNIVLHGCDRPILILDPNESIAQNPLLIYHGDRLYEIGFPYLKPSDLEHYEYRCQSELSLSINEVEYLFYITDEVIDKAAIEDETQLEEWLDKPWSNRLDNSVSSLLQKFNGVFTSKDLWSCRLGDLAWINLHHLSNYLSKFDSSEASLPLVISLDRQYKLARKLREITLKLRHQLRRKAELMPIGRIQEMDSYCLRDYIRRPGHSPEEKAGAKQQLMGIVREQNFNTIENKFLVYFAGKLLHLECFRYEKSNAIAHQDEIKNFRQTIDIFKRSPLIKNISIRHFKLTKPNYVLLQNPIYNSFYRAYLDYVYKRSEKERLWSYRTKLLGDTVYLCLIAALLRFQGVQLKPLANLKIRTSPDCGNYLLGDWETISIQIFLQDLVYEFKLAKNSDLSKGDYCLTIELHDLNSSDLTTKTKSFPIWSFWYKPSDEIINSANNYLKSNFHNYSLGILFYLPTFPEKERKIKAEMNSGITTDETSFNSDSKLTKEEEIWLCQIADPRNSKSFNPIVNFLATEIIKPLAEMVK